MVVFQSDERHLHARALFTATMPHPQFDDTAKLIPSLSAKGLLKVGTPVENVDTGQNWSSTPPGTVVDRNPLHGHYRTTRIEVTFKAPVGGLRMSPLSSPKDAPLPSARAKHWPSPMKTLSAG